MLGKLTEREFESQPEIWGAAPKCPDQPPFGGAAQNLTQVVRLAST